jgi:uncharacterized membrane protein HdeD (DUF308 family)
MSKTDLVPWWLILLQGLLALIIGIYLILYPIRTTIYLVGVLGWYWLFVGLLTLGTILMDRTDWMWRAISGILGILAGIVVIGHPLWSALLVPETLVIIAGVLTICFGALSLFWAMREGWGAAIAGVLSILFGLLILGSPLLGIAMMIYILAGLAIVAGITSIYLAFQLR